MDKNLEWRRISPLYPTLHKKGQIVVKIHTTPWFVDFHHNLPLIFPYTKNQADVILLYVSLASPDSKTFPLSYPKTIV